MNHLENISSLKNRYFAMRHGRSEGNLRNIVVSHPDIGVANFGLIDEGRKKAAETIKKYKDLGLLDSSTVIYSSDFTRCRETAEIARQMLEAGPIYFVPELRERFFGDFDGQKDDIYKTVWQRDNLNPAQKENNVESVLEVIGRTSKLVAELEARYSGEKILLVSHGDTLQMLLAAFEKNPPIKTHILPYVHTGDILEYQLK